MQDINISLVIPVYNEETRIEEQVNFLKKLIEANPGWEFIFVDDGSKDDTKQILQKKFGKQRQVKIISYHHNQGKGYAIKRGVAIASKKYLLFTDIDFSTPISELNLFEPFIKSGAQIVAGTRKVKGAQITKHQKMLREWLGRQFTNLTNLILGLDISDYTCGFKLFQADIAKELFAKSVVRRWAFDAEILFLANFYNYRIVEVPVTWHNDERTKVNLINDIWTSFKSLILIRLNQIRGLYK